jgi:polar amino acid transport system substrate-binding protein
MWRIIGRSILIFLSVVFVATFIFLAVFYFQHRPINQTAKISGHPEWPPIMYRFGDKIIGAGPEIIAKIFAEIGLTADFDYAGSWDEVQDKARSGEIDFLVAAYSTEERKTYMEYSVPYTFDPVILVVKKGRGFSYEIWSDLLGLKGVATLGDSYGQQFDDYLKNNLDVDVVVTPEEAVSLLKNNQADYFIYSLYSAERMMQFKNLSEEVEILPEYVSTENFYLTVSKKSPFVKYLPLINSLLEKYKEDGTIDRIIWEHKNNFQFEENVSE